MIETKPNIPDNDGFYAALIDAHHGKSKAESEAFNARLILILANQIGDAELLTSALRAAEV